MTVKAKQPADGRVRVERRGGGLEFHNSTRTLGASCFLLIWLALWTFGCIALIVEIFKEPKLFTFLFGIPFWAAWLLVFLILARMLFGRERLRIDSDGLTYESFALIRLRRRKVPRSELIGAKTSKAAGRGGARQRCVIIETGGNDIRFGDGISAAEQRWLAELLNKYIGKPVEEAEPDLIVAEVVDAAEKEARRPRKTKTVLKPVKLPVEPPSGTRLRLRREIGELAFIGRGRWSLAAIGGMTFICLFWNGIVSVFVLTLFQEFQWFLALFLIPFELVGLLILVGWLSAVLAPLRTVRWHFGRREIRHQGAFLGIGRWKDYAVVPLERIELIHSRAEKNANQTIKLDVLDGDFALRFVTKEGDKLVDIPGLKKGEARWLGDVVQREFPSWFEY